jgi:hypothetical protein
LQTIKNGKVILVKQFNIFNTDNYGEVTVRNAMLEDPNGTDIYEGIEIKGDDVELIEIMGYYDLDDLTEDDVENFIETF